MKYLLDLINLLKGLKNGITLYPRYWKDQPYTPETIQADIDLLTAKNDGLDVEEKALSKMQKEARLLEKEKQAVADKIVKIASGFHADNPDQLVDYGLKPRKSPEAKPRPTKQLTVSLEDDSDGVGFVVSTPADPDATTYEWEKGTAANPADTKIIPELTFFKTTSKTSFVDDDVAKGVRYFYSVRAVNSAGDGPWSEPASRVQ